MERRLPKARTDPRQGTVSFIDSETMSFERNLDTDLMHRKDKKLNNGARGMALIP